MQEHIKQTLAVVANTITEFSGEENCRKMSEIAGLLTDCFQKKRKVLICGNGGSNCDAMHFAEEFTGRFRKDRRPLPVISLSDSSHITCVANDYGFEEVFSRGVAAYGEEGDVLIALSTSGNSENVIRALKQAKASGMVTVGLLGRDGGKMKNMCDHELTVAAETTDRIQEVHMIILHILIEMTERELFPGNYK